MQINRLAALLLSLSIAVAMGQDDSADDAADVQSEQAQTNEQGQGAVTTPELPSQFIPKEKISPDQVISFPADI